MLTAGTLLLSGPADDLLAEPAAAAAPAAGGAGEGPEEMEGIDPEFLAALPPDMQAEVLEQQRLERRRRQAAAQREATLAVRKGCCFARVGSCGGGRV